MCVRIVRVLLDGVVVCDVCDVMMCWLIDVIIGMNLCLFVRVLMVKMFVIEVVCGDGGGGGYGDVFARETR